MNKAIKVSIFSLLLLVNVMALVININYLFKKDGPIDQISNKNEQVEVTVTGYITVNALVNGEKVVTYKLEVELEGQSRIVSTQYKDTIFTMFEKKFPIGTKLQVKVKDLEPVR